MIGQNRQARMAEAKAKAKASHDFVEQEELRTNTEPARAIHELARRIHAHSCGSKTA